MTTPYSPATATALAIGATDQGYVEYSGVAWDNDVASWNLRSLGERADLIALDQRDAQTALHRALCPPTATARIMCVGDSLTLGTGSTDGAGYRPWLDSLLVRRRTSVAFTVVAEGGQTLRHMAPLALGALPTAQPDIVLVNIGTNDAVQPDMADFQARYGTFVDAILASSPTVRVACARIAMSRETWMANAQAPVNTAVDQVVAARQAGGRVAAADMTVLSSRHTVDGTHPLNYLRAAQQWANAIAPWLPTS